MIVDREQLAWAAGLFEGEGCFYGRTDTGGSRMAFASISMTDEEPLKAFAEVIGIGKLNGPYASKKPNHKPKWIWQTTTFEHYQAVVALLWPWLSVRRKTAAKTHLLNYLQHPKKERKPLGDDAVKTIRARCRNGESQLKVARDFGVCQAWVSLIVRDKRRVAI